MKERNHDQLTYEGTPGEKVTLRITATGTTHMVTYKLNGLATQVLSKGSTIEFNLKAASGQRTDLQIVMDGTTRGSYELIVENVSNCKNDLQHVGKCIDIRKAPPKKNSLYAFFVA